MGDQFIIKGLSPDGTPRGIATDNDGNLQVDVVAGGAGGGPVTIADAADITQGALADPEVAGAGPASVIAILKRLRTLFSGGLPAALGQGNMAQGLRVVIASDQTIIPTSVPDGQNATIGALNDAAVATDANGSLSGKLRGFVKWTAERMPAIIGQLTKAESLAVTLASDEDALGVTGTFWQVTQPVSGAFFQVTQPVSGTFWQATQPVSTEGATIAVTPAVTIGAYTAGDCVGGELTFANAARVSGGGGVIKDMILIDDNGQDVEMELWLFDATITSPGDNAPWVCSEVDLRKLIAIITSEDGAWFACGTPSACRVESSQRYDVDGTSMFGQLVTREAPTFAATDDVTVSIGLLQD